MRTILSTGATGFLGSALVANLLAEGIRVKALSRGDPGGERVRAAVGKAAKGFGFSLHEEHWELLTSVEVDFRDLQGTLDPHLLEDVTDVWNVAGEMSDSLQSILQAVAQNVVASSSLYDLTARHAPRCQRFYHVSTAYTVGFGVEEAHERINFMPTLINSYQLSKWVAELTLLQHQRERGLPLTLFRPSIIIGHQDTGWSSGVGFGLFSLAEGILQGKRMDASRLQLDLRGEAQMNLVCIDTVVRRAQALLRARQHRQPTEIFHCIGDEPLRVAEALEPAWHLLGLRVAFGPPRLTVDDEVNRIMEKHKPFADATWLFHADHLKTVLGDAYVPQPMNQEIVRRSLTHYLAHRIKEIAEQGPARSAPVPQEQSVAL